MSAWRRLKYRILLRLAAATLFWERLWPRLWPAAGLSGLFIAAALIGLPRVLPPWLHAGGLVLLAGAMAYALGRGVAHIGRPGRAASRHRIETDSGLVHRPLAALEDRPATGHDPETQALWTVHRTRMDAALGRLRLRLPAPNLAAHDPWALRALVVLLMAIGLGIGHDDIPGRLRAAILPAFAAVPAPRIAVEGWIAPPTHTGTAPIFLSQESLIEDPLAVPEGSALTIQAGGLRTAPQLHLGTETLAFQPLGEDEDGRTFRLETTLSKGDGLVVEIQGRRLADWPIRILPDTPPTIIFEGPPETTPRGLLAIPYHGTDDYGLAGIELELQRAGGPAVSSGETLQRSLPLPAAPAKAARGTARLDLTAHLWAGEVVRGRLRARDAAGQTSETETIDFILPERVFEHPVAREIAEQRKRLATPDAATRAAVGEALAGISGHPERFAGDAVVFLGLTMARARLRLGPSPDGITAVTDLLWELALRLEEGGLSLAERELERLNRELAEALRERAGGAEIERLAEALDQALRNFLAELARELRASPPSDGPIDPETPMLDGSELQRLIDEARELARAGALDAAREKLAQLQRLIDDLTGALAQEMTPEQQRQAEAAQRLMQALQGIVTRQENLMDDTFKRLRGATGGDERTARVRREAARADAERQDRLRRDLGNLMLEIDRLAGGIPDPLGEAEQAMRQAGEALAGARDEDALESQAKALEALRQGGGETGQKMARRLGLPGGLIRRGTMPAVGQMPGRDPFGRVREGGQGGIAGEESVNIPNRSELRRIQDILEELHRRGGDRRRPALERDYIERLLRRF